MNTSRPDTAATTTSEVASVGDGPVWTIVVAAGSGTRFGGAVPKQFVEVAGRRIVDWSTATAAAASDGVVVVLPASGEHTIDGESGGATPVTAVAGGATRSESVRRGLAAVPADAAVIVVHDAARPVASQQLFERVIAAVRAGADAVVPTVPVIDTLRTIDGEPVDRDQLVAVQTPQAFAARALRDAHESGATATDDASLVGANGGKVLSVNGERWNLKVTDPRDDRVACALLDTSSGPSQP